MEQNKKLFEKFYNYCKNETSKTQADFEQEWQKMADKTTEEAKATFDKVIQNDKLQKLLDKMTEEEQKATIEFLSKTLTYIFMEKNTTGTTKVLEKLKGEA